MRPSGKILDRELRERLVRADLLRSKVVCPCTGNRRDPSSSELLDRRVMACSYSFDSFAQFRDPSRRAAVRLYEGLCASARRRGSFDGTAPTIDICLEAPDVAPSDVELLSGRTRFDAEPLIRHRLDLGADSNVLGSPLLRVEGDESLVELSDPPLFVRMVNQPIAAVVVASPEVDEVGCELVLSRKFVARVSEVAPR